MISTPQRQKNGILWTLSCKVLKTLSLNYSSDFSETADSVSHSRFEANLGGVRFYRRKRPGEIKIAGDNSWKKTLLV
jgi:hypothetical protein